MLHEAGSHHAMGLHELGKHFLSILTISVQCLMTLIAQPKHRAVITWNIRNL